MAKKVIISVVAVVAVAAGIYFWPKGSRQHSQITPSPSLPQTFVTPTISAVPFITVESTAQPQPNIVTYTDAGYSPNTLRIKAGTTVAFMNENSRAMWTASDLHPSHRIYADSALSEHCPDNAGTAFDACTSTQPGSSWSFKFTKKGAWSYHNHLMPGHTGTIVVE